MSERKFISKLVQVDFTNVRWCPVLNCVVMYEDKIFLAQNTMGVREGRKILHMDFFQVIWNTKVG